jgi:hypothetical protein
MEQLSADFDIGEENALYSYRALGITFTGE